MTIKKRHVEGLVSADPVSLTAVGLGASYGRILGFNARNYASSAKASGGTDTSIKVKITDGDSRVVYLEASARDYTTEKAVRFAADDTSTGLDPLVVDATGAAITAGGGQGVIAKSPVTVALVGGGTATDYFSIDLLVEV